MKLWYEKLLLQWGRLCHDGEVVKLEIQILWPR